MNPIILAVLALIQQAGPQIVEAWKKLHSDDPSKADWTDADAIADLLTSGTNVQEKWDTYRATHPV